MKKLRRIVALAALLLAGGLFWGQERGAYSEKEFKELLAEYNVASQVVDYNLTRTIANILEFEKAHPDFLSVHVDLAILFFKARSVKDATTEYKRAQACVQKVPDSPEGKLEKAKYYQLSTEMNLYVFQKESAAKKEAKLCAQNDKILGAKVSYMLASRYMEEKKLATSYWEYQNAFDLDSGFGVINENDIKNYSYVCKKGRAAFEIPKFYERYFNASKSRYFPNLGALATTYFEKGKNKPKAVLSAMLDQEYTDTAKELSPAPMISVLERDFGKDKEAAACVAFIRKFYDKDKSLGQEDLDSLPQGVRNFLTVRYMYKMKTSDDVAKLREEFEPFFHPIGRFYIRLYEKAKKNGDKAAMDELQKIIKEVTKN